MKKYNSKFIVTKNVSINYDYNIVELTSYNSLPKINPGQFVELRVDTFSNSYLRRPFSIHRVDESRKSIQILVKIVGNSTMAISKIKQGDELDLIFPLGNWFSIVENSKVMLVGGGCGVAPLLFLADELKKQNNEICIVLGGRSKKDILLINDFNTFGSLYITTEDGSLGEKGLITNHTIFNKISQFDMIYTCGPNPMMKAVSQIAFCENVQCEVSLENTMACGIGACLCCVVNTKNGNECVCTKGPVFNSTYLSAEWVKSSNLCNCAKK